MAERLWSNPGNPPRWVAERLGVSQWDFSDALHKIKKAAGLRGTDSVTIWQHRCRRSRRGDREHV
jgi:hypothetical protein